MDYCIDTSVFITASRTYYAFDIAPLFWKALLTLAENGIVITPIAVYSEIMSGDDDLKQWAKDHKKTIFIDPDSAVVDAYRQIADFANNQYDDAHWIRDFLAGADPWVIAQAKASNLIVVTTEGKKSSEEVNRATNRYRGKIKIPNICSHFGINCISTFELLRNQKIELGKLS